MPRIPEAYLDVVAFLYRSKEAAEKGRGNGAGEAFLMAYPGDQGSMATHFYIVTNLHCVHDGLAIRMTKRHPTNPSVVGTEIMVTDKDDWIPHPEGYDVAVHHITDKHFSDRNIAALGTMSGPMPFWMFATHNIGPGHDVYLLSRLQGLDAPEWNIPIVQSGAVAALPMNPLPGFFDEPFFLIETHSRVGYSGAPVFAYVSADDEQLTKGPIGSPAIMQELPALFLIGVFSQHAATYAAVVDQPDRDGKAIPGYFAQTPSALGVVVPAWEILDILQSDEAMRRRRTVEQQWGEEGEPGPASANT